MWLHEGMGESRKKALVRALIRACEGGGGRDVVFAIYGVF